jgi:hypothetical protein
METLIKDPSNMTLLSQLLNQPMMLSHTHKTDSDSSTILKAKLILTLYKLKREIFLLKYSLFVFAKTVIIVQTYQSFQILIG